MTEALAMVKATEGEAVELRDLSTERDPSAVVAEAMKAAKILADVVAKKTKPVIFNGEQFLEFEDWQTVAGFYGVSAKTGDAEPVEINGVQGFRAKARSVHVATGNIVSEAEAYCMRDEPNWKGKPTFQLASMAQTRAGAKCLRNTFARVVVLAGYRPTPAEEMDGKTNGNDEKPKDAGSPNKNYEPAKSDTFWIFPSKKKPGEKSIGVCPGAKLLPPDLEELGFREWKGSFYADFSEARIEEIKKLGGVSK